MDIKLFQQKLNDICAIAEENNKQLSQQQIRDHFDESAWSPHSRSLPAFGYPSESHQRSGTEPPEMSGPLVCHRV